MENNQKLEAYYRPMLDMDKIKGIEDCKKVLNFLCGIVLEPISKNLEYTGFCEVRQYFRK